ncbi:MAG: hypothetical protein RMX68_011320 [Aulosira sp. ZfuVER01]|nr:hypothetical protein [Aulosira sp. DedVER01a]
MSVGSNLRVGIARRRHHLLLWFNNLSLEMRSPKLNLPSIDVAQDCNEYNRCDLAKSLSFHILCVTLIMKEHIW